MAQDWKIFGAEMSPYSVKVRSYLHFKGLPYQWLQRSAHQEEFEKHSKLPIVPLVLSPTGEAMQDSTPIMDAIEKQHPTPRCLPDDPLLAWLAVLLEEYSDEWLNKLMFHFRWWDETDQHAAARALSRGFAIGQRAQWDDVAKVIFERMTQRGAFVGSSKATAPLLVEYFDTSCALWEAHFGKHHFAFGSRPSYADFGIYCEFYQLYLDPGTGGDIRARFPNIMTHCHRTLLPRDEGSYADWSTLAPTLTPILADIGSHFLVWTTANAKALADGAEEFSVALAGKTYTQQPQKYHAKSLKVLREKYATMRNAEIDTLMEQTGCLPYLTE